MTFYQGLATVLLRVWAAVYLIESVGAFASLGIGWVTQPTDSDESLRSYYVTNLMSYAVYFVVGTALWILAPHAGRLVSAAIPTGAPSSSIDNKRIIEIGAFLIGVYFLAVNAPQALAESIEVFIKAAKETDAERLAGGGARYFVQWGTLGQHWAAVIVALVIGLRARDFAKLFSWLRSAGRYREKDAPEKSASGE
jgi:hypothetical protein